MTIIKKIQIHSLVSRISDVNDLIDNINSKVSIGIRHIRPDFLFASLICFSGL